MDVETGLVGGGITAAIVALIYTVKKVASATQIVAAVNLTFLGR